MIDIAGWLEFVKLAPGYAIALIIYLYKREDDKAKDAALEKMVGAYQVLLEKVLTVIPEINKTLDGLIQATKIGERLGAIEDAMDGKARRSKRV